MIARERSFGTCRLSIHRAKDNAVLDHYCSSFVGGALYSHRFGYWSREKTVAKRQGFGAVIEHHAQFEIVAAGSGQMLVGMSAMVRARLAAASDFGKLASRPASPHGSCPSRANTESTLSVMPFASVPIAAKRNSFNPDRRKAKASVLGISIPR